MAGLGLYDDITLLASEANLRSVVLYLKKNKHLKLPPFWPKNWLSVAGGKLGTCIACDIELVLIYLMCLLTCCYACCDVSLFCYDNHNKIKRMFNAQ